MNNRAPSEVSRAARARKIARRVLAGFVVLALLGPALVACSGTVRLGGDWRTADRSSAHLAPGPAAESRAVVQVYAARAFAWRGLFAVHTWIATKPAGADHYMVHQVVGWRRWSGRPAVVSAPDIPDRSWYGQPPEVLVDLRGPPAEAAIEQIRKAIETYPWPEAYVLWPGPNSNTFTAWIARRVPALGLDLPPTAIGKDYLGTTGILARAPSGTGWQISVFGLLGLTLAHKEGLEINVLTAGFGFNPLTPALRLPGLGILGSG